MTTLDDLGPRICVMGPSNSGKSTLAEAIARRQDLPPVHLDQLYHLPFTDWEPRRTADFVRLHDEAIAHDRWVMDGNYANCMPQRLARATGLILLDCPTAISLYRYVLRCWRGGSRRGGLAGGQDSVKWAMLRHIAVVTPPKRARYQALFDQLALPKVYLRTPRALDEFRRREQLPAP
ncbi:AAA family ATPase [Xylophilus sp. GOD-11R]|uniref:AAA family ATPase n=1 Tax=Xylophilus sp. GOD-11R TaxID=3089814 RepID=UPI00298BEA38|nr:AAA family ATPase [Xylophilus sp. GOD-11R]WPB58514.1 AAA family ATPase [Xylophilus sp. GOD-11R]